MCGNLGFVICDEVVDAAQVVAAMGQITAMRGAQSFGFVASSLTKMSTFKAVATKRSDIGLTMAKALERRVLGGPTRSCRGKQKRLAVLGHLRFATSSKTLRHEAHPHTWLGTRKVDLVVGDGAGKCTKISSRRLVQITHNGDFEAFDVGGCFGNPTCWLPVTEVRHWLAARLGLYPRSEGDSINVAGLIELLFCAGDPFAAARCGLAGLSVAQSPEAAERVGAALKGALLANKDPITAMVAVMPPVDAKKAKAAAERALEAFYVADLRSAARRFLAHAKGAFGLAACSSLAPCSVVVGCVKQPMVVGVGEGFFAYASERAALHVGVVDEKILARRVLFDGEVICVSHANCREGSFCVSSASIHNGEPFRDLVAGDFDATVNNRRMMSPVASIGAGSDVVGQDLLDTPRILAELRDTFRGGSYNMTNPGAGGAAAMTPHRRRRDDTAPSDNYATAKAFATCLLTDPEARRLDLVVIGVEASLWLAEQWAANLRSACPNLRVVATSANKVLSSLTACANESTCGAATSGATVFPSGATAEESVRGSVALCVAHSGQTFPTLNAAVALQAAGATVFGVCGTLDTALATILGQKFAPDAPHCRRIMSTGAGIRVAEPASLTTLATHVLLTELLFVVARELAQATTKKGPEEEKKDGTARGAALVVPWRPSDRCACDLTVKNVEQLEALQDASLEKNVGLLCSPEGCGRDARRLGRVWGRHVAEPAFCFFAAVAYVVITVTLGTPLFSSVARAAGLGAGHSASTTGAWYAVRFADAMLYAFFPVACALFLRAVQGRELLARFGKRTVLVLDVPQVNQCITAFAQKLFALSFGLNGLDVAGANPSDHAVHKCLHRVVRGTLVALGVPDGRLKALVDAECAAYLTASQFKSMSNWGVGPELFTVGHHSYAPTMVDGAVIFDAFDRPPIFHELDTIDRSTAVGRTTAPPEVRRVAYLHKGAENETKFVQRHAEAVHDALVEALYEGRVATLERQLAFYVMFHELARYVSTNLGPVLRFDTWRSQAGTRVATTPSPTSPSVEPSAKPHALTTDSHAINRSIAPGSSFTSLAFLTKSPFVGNRPRSNTGSRSWDEDDSINRSATRKVRDDSKHGGSAAAALRDLTLLYDRHAVMDENSSLDISRYSASGVDLSYTPATLEPPSAAATFLRGTDDVFDVGLDLSTHMAHTAPSASSNDNNNPFPVPHMARQQPKPSSPVKISQASITPMQKLSLDASTPDEHDDLPDPSLLPQSAPATQTTTTTTMTTTTTPGDSGTDTFDEVHGLGAV